MRSRKWLYPLLVLVAAVVASVAILVARPRATAEVIVPPAPLVRAVTVEAGDVHLTVRTQGRVAPRSEIDLVAEASGIIVEVAPALAAGGFFTEGDVLVRIDPHDYELAVERSRAEVARAETMVAMEEAEADVAVREWSAMGNNAKAPALVARRPQVAQARASLAAATAVLAQATKDLERTTVRAPFTGRVRHENADLGQFVARGATLARIYSTDAAEIRLPLPDAELAFLDMPLAYRDSDAATAGPEVTVHADFAGRRWQWSGRIVRIEGQVDPETHVVHVVAAVSDPYARAEGSERPPLSAGMFVDADIAGRLNRGVVVVPRAALRGEARVLVIDSDDRLRLRDVTILRREPERVLVTAGLAGGERVCVSPLDVVAEGMKVRVAGDAAIGAAIEDGNAAGAAGGALGTAADAASPEDGAGR